MISEALCGVFPYALKEGKNCLALRRERTALLAFVPKY
jgi:hypothetical protein